MKTKSHKEKQKWIKGEKDKKEENSSLLLRHAERQINYYDILEILSEEKIRELEGKAKEVKGSK